VEAQILHRHRAAHRLVAVAHDRAALRRRGTSPQLSRP
jgi:hypothetical protein